MIKTLLTLVFSFVFLLLPAVSFGQTSPSNKDTGTVSPPSVTITASTSPEELARVAFTAQGGEKFRKVESMVLRGSVDLFAPNSTQSIPGGFVIATAGDKVRIEIDARPAVSFKQIYDGQQSYSSIPGVELPPASKFGLLVLSKYDQPGYKISAIPDKKKLRGFRLTDPDGNATEFYVDPTTGRIMSFFIGYNGYTFATENKKFKNFEGILVATSFTQRLEMPQGAFFADYNVKDVKLNQQLDNDVFAIPN
jgi:hypothetical protein